MLHLRVAIQLRYYIFLSPVAMCLALWVWVRNSYAFLCTISALSVYSLLVLFLLFYEVNKQSCIISDTKNTLKFNCLRPQIASFLMISFEHDIFFSAELLIFSASIVLWCGELMSKTSAKSTQKKSFDFSNFVFVPSPFSANLILFAISQFPASAEDIHWQMAMFVL